MPPTSAADQESIRQKLDRALKSILDELRQDDSLSTVSIEKVAQVAEVSRATAYRYLGSREELLRRSAIALVEDHITKCQEALARTTTVAQRVEEYFVYALMASESDPRIRVLTDSPRTSGIDAALREMTVIVLAPSIQAGQLDGQVREDIPIDELIAWLMTQTELLNRRRLLTISEEEIRTWVRRFILPVLDPPGNTDGRLRSQVRSLLDDVQVRLQEVNVSIATARYTFRA